MARVDIKNTNNNIEVDPPTKKNQAIDVSKMSDLEYLKAIATPTSRRLEQGNFGPIATPSGTGSKYDASFVASPYLNTAENMKALQSNRGLMQPWTEQALAGVAQLPVSIITGLGETAGYMFDWTEVLGVQKDYGNWLSNTMKDWKKSFQDEVAPIYRKNLDDPYDLSDSGMYFQTASDMISSIAQFAIAGAGIGGVLGKTASAITEGFMLAEGTGAALKGGAQLLTNLGLTYTESMMNANDVYNQSKQMALETGMYTEEQATQLASQSASKALKLGMINIIFNHTGLKPVFRGMNVVSVAEREAMERVGKMAATNVLENEVLSKALNYATRLGEAPGTIVSKMNTIRHALTEAGQEYLEETVGAVAQNEGMYHTKQKLGMVQNSSFISRLNNVITSEEGIAQGLMGAIGGFGSGMVMQGAMGREAARQKDIMFAQHIETLKQNKDTIDVLFKGAKQDAILKNINDQALRGDEAAYKSAKNDMLRELFKENAKNGTTEGLLQQLEAVANTSQKDAVTLGFITDKDNVSGLVSEANESIKNVKEWSKIYDSVNSNYPIASKYVLSTTNAKGEQDVQLVSDVIFDAAVKTKQAEAQYKEYVNEANKIKTEYTNNSKLSNQANEVASLTVDREVTKTFVDGFLKPRLAELLSGQTEINEPLVKAYTDLIKGNEQKIAAINEQIKGIEEVAKETGSIEQLKDDLRIAHTTDLDQYAEKVSKALTADYSATTAASSYNHLTSKEFLNNLDKKSTETQIKEQVKQAEKEATATKQAVKTATAAKVEKVAAVQENPFAGVNTGVDENIVVTEEEKKKDLEDIKLVYAKKGDIVFDIKGNEFEVTAVSKDGRPITIVDKLFGATLDPDKAYRINPVEYLNIQEQPKVTTEKEIKEEEIVTEDTEDTEEEKGDIVNYIDDEGNRKQGTILNKDNNTGLITIRDTDGNIDVVGVFSIEVNSGPIELEAQTPPEEENDAPLNDGVIITSDPIVTFEATANKSPEAGTAVSKVNAFKGAASTRTGPPNNLRKRTAEEQAKYDKHNSIVDHQYRDEQIKNGDTIHYEFTFGGEDYNNENVLEGDYTPRIDMVHYDSSNTRRVVDKAASPYSTGKIPNKKVNVNKLLHLYEDVMTLVKASSEYQAWLKDKSKTFTIKTGISAKVTGKYFGYIETVDHLNNLNEVYGALNNKFPIVLGVVITRNGIPKLEFNNIESLDVNESNLVYNINELQPGRIYSIIPGCNGKYTVSRCFTRHVNESEVQEVFDLIAKAEISNLNGKGGIREKINSLVPVYFGKDAESKKLQFNVVTNEAKNGVDIWVGQKRISKAVFLETIQNPAKKQQVIDWFTKNQYRQVNGKILNEMNNNEKYTTGSDPIITANLPTNGRIVTDGNIEVSSYERPAKPATTPKVESNIDKQKADIERRRKIELKPIEDLTTGIRGALNTSPYDRDSANIGEGFRTIVDHVELTDEEWKEVRKKHAEHRAKTITNKEFHEWRKEFEVRFGTRLQQTINDKYDAELASLEPKVETKVEPVVTPVTPVTSAKKQYARPSVKPLSTTEVVKDNSVENKEADAIVDKSKDISKDDVDNTKKYCK